MDENPSIAEVREHLRSIVARSGRLLDAGRFEEFLALFDEKGTYVLDAHSPEIGRDMVWLSLDQTGLKALFDEWPSHIHDQSKRKHLITVDEIELAPDTATVYSTFAVFRTDENGRSALFCIGSYEDQFSDQLTYWKLTARRVTVETRFLSTPTPIPL